MSNIQLDLISDNKLSEMLPVEKVRFIISEVKKGKILVLEKGLTPMEEAKLIEMTMAEISEDFVGIEIESYPRESSPSFLDKLLRRSTNQKLTVVGPANKLRTLRKDKNLISTLVSSESR